MVFFFPSVHKSHHQPVEICATRLREEDHKCSCQMDQELTEYFSQTRGTPEGPREYVQVFGQTKGKQDEYEECQEERADVFGQSVGTSEGPPEHVKVYGQTIGISEGPNESTEVYSQIKGMQQDNEEHSEERADVFGQTRGMPESSEGLQEGRTVFSQAKGAFLQNPEVENMEIFAQNLGVIESDAEHLEHFAHAKGISDSTGLKNGGLNTDLAEFYGQSRGLQEYPKGDEMLTEFFSQTRGAAAGVVNQQEGTEKSRAFGQIKGVLEVTSTLSSGDVEKLPPSDESCRCQAVIYLKGTDEKVAQEKKEWFEGCECVVLIAKMLIRSNQRLS